MKFFFCKRLYWMDDRELDLQLGYILFVEVDWLSQNSSMYILILYQKCTGTLGLEIFLYKQNIDIIMVYQTIFYVLAGGVRLNTNTQGRFLCRQRPVFPFQYSFYSKDDSHSLGEDSAHWIWSMSDPSRLSHLSKQVEVNHVSAYNCNLVSLFLSIIIN